MKKVQIALVTGLSGAGKSSCMSIFENLGFRCIDNYPIELLDEFVNLLKTSHHYAKVALVVPLSDTKEVTKALSNVDWINLQILFLDASDDVIVKRYKQTRRAHPLLIDQKASSLIDAIQFERKLSIPVQRIANKIIDTSSLRISKLQDTIEGYYLNFQTELFRISFVSFGYKYGIPKDLDLMFDVRFLPNPFYIEELQDGTGNDQKVYDYVMNQQETKEFIDKLTPMLDYLFQKFQMEGRMHLVVGIGCTGGQHRSVTLTNYFANYYQEQYQVHRLHRDANH